MDIKTFIGIYAKALETKDNDALLAELELIGKDEFQTDIFDLYQTFLLMKNYEITITQLQNMTYLLEQLL